MTEPNSLDRHTPAASMFRKQIGFLVKNYTPISIFDFLRILDENELIRSYVRPPVLLGFDDGFRSVIVNGIPILNEFRVPAVFFVVAKKLTDPQFVPWFLEVKHILRRTTRERIFYEGVEADLVSEQGRDRLVDLFATLFRSCCSEEERDRLLTSVAELLNVRRPAAADLDADLDLVSREDLARLGDSSPLTVASHGMTHRHLAGLTYEEQLDELWQSDSVLREHCRSYCPVIAYPSGSFNAATIDIAKRIYAAGFAVFAGSSHRNRYAYPRIGIGQGDARELAYLFSPLRLTLKRALHVAGIRREK